MSDIVEKLKEACVGHPAASIPWPHRLLHNAADEITTLRRELAEARAEVERLKEALTIAQDDRFTQIEKCMAAEARCEKLEAALREIKETIDPIVESSRSTQEKAVYSAAVAALDSEED